MFLCFYINRLVLNFFKGKMSQFLNSINEVKKNYSKYDDWEQKQADEKAQKLYLAKTLDIPKDKLELTEEKAKTVIRAAELLDNRSENNAENMEQLTGILSSIAILIPAFGSELLLMQMMKKGKKIPKGLQFASPVLTLATAVGLILWGNAKQKEASRIGRFQAKQNELKDVKNFVIYTPEQIERAVEKAKEIPDEKERKGLMKLIAEMKDVFSDKEAYKKWMKSKDPQAIEKLKELACTPEQLKQGEADKELIVDAVKDINIKAEEYSENVENVFDTMSTVSWLAAIPLTMGANKILKHVNKFPQKFRPLVSTVVGLAVGIGITLWGTAEQKNAARIGRYKARQELMKNPASLLAFSKEEMEQAKDVKAPEQKINFWKKIGQNFSFLPQYLKDKKEYNEYKEKTQKQNEKIINVLKQDTTISEKQLNDAKHLQEKVFTAFDEVDEMSQRYSEDVEAGTDIAKEVGVSIWTIGSMGALAAAAVLTSKGKFPLHKIIKGISSMSLDKNSKLKTAIDKVYDAVKGDKNLKQKLNYAIAHGDFSEIKYIPKLKEPLRELMTEFGSVTVKLKDGEQAALEALKTHFKKGAIAKWFRSFTYQCLKLWGKNKSSSMGIELPKEVAENLKFNYKNYNTLINTGLVAGAPVLGIIIGVPYAFNAWLTNIQKKAGKIGIMKAMEKIDDDRVFVNHNENTTAKQKAEAPAIAQSSVRVISKEDESSNLLAKFRQSVPQS